MVNSTYVENVVIVNASQHHQGAENGQIMMQYSCYPASQDHLEVKYQAAFGNALDSHNTSIETPAEVNAQSTSSEMEHLRMQSALQQPSMLTNIESSATQMSSEFHYEYETNYGNNEWTTTSASSTNYGYTITDSYQTDSSAATEPDMPVMPNYCFAACVFTPSVSVESSSPHIKAEIGNGYSSSPTQARHFEAYEYAAPTIVHEPLHQAL